MRSASASTWAGRSGLPLSSLASMSTTQPGVGEALGLGGLDGDEGGEGGVAVVGAAAPVEPVALDDRRPRAEAVAPAGHLRLLVEVPVQQDGAVGERRVGGRHLAHDQRREAGQAVDVDGEPGDRSRRAPVADQLDGLAPCSRAPPTSASKALRDVGDADVLGQRRQDVVGPASVDAVRQSGRGDAHLLSVADATCSLGQHDPVEHHTAFEQARPASLRRRDAHPLSSRLAHSSLAAAACSSVAARSSRRSSASRLDGPWTATRRPTAARRRSSTGAAIVRTPA